MSLPKRIETARLAGVMAERNRLLRICMMIQQRAIAKVDEKLFTTVPEQRAAELKLTVAFAVLQEVVKNVQGGVDPQPVKNNNRENNDDSGGGP